jgi:GNAT superfamily N-acetyltransferase
VSRSHVRVRPAELADIPQLVTLVESADLPLGALGARPFRSETVARLPERFAGILSAGDRTVLVAVEDATDDVVGLVVVSDDEVGAITPTPVLNVSHMVVAPRHRRRGVGRALLAATVHLADQRGVEHLVASAISGARDANRYLARLGFAPLAVRRIAPTFVLRRSLGLVDGGERLALLRRVRGGGRPGRAGVGAARSIGRGA